jgi:hypothetical protein
MLIILIKTLGTGTSVKSLGLDTDGNVVTVSATVSTWSLLGNSVTSTDFIGTTNNQDIRFKRENVNISVALSSVFFGSNNWFTSYW